MNRGEVEIAADGEKSPAYAGMNRCFANSKRANAQKPRVCEDMLCIACIAVKGRRTDRIVLQKS